MYSLQIKYMVAQNISNTLEVIAAGNHIMSSSGEVERKIII